MAVGHLDERSRHGRGPGIQPRHLPGRHPHLRADRVAQRPAERAGLGAAEQHGYEPGGEHALTRPADEHHLQPGLGAESAGRRQPRGAGPEHDHPAGHGRLRPPAGGRKPTSQSRARIPWHAPSQGGEPRPLAGCRAGPPVADRAVTVPPRRCRLAAQPS
jgi:hypothetical protein